MSREHAVIVEENVRIPADALTFEGFRSWSHSPEFPTTGRIDYLSDHVEVDLSPEDLHTHGIVKVARRAEQPRRHHPPAERLAELRRDRPEQGDERERPDPGDRRVDPLPLESDEETQPERDGEADEDFRDQEGPPLGRCYGRDCSVGQYGEGAMPRRPSPVSS